MNFSDTIRGLWRRWYIVLPGLVIAASLAVGTWYAVPPGYERSSTQLLIPGAESMPDGANPYLFLGGLAPAADVIVRAVGAENVLNEVVEEHPGVEIEVSRDTTTAGPVILIVVTAASDAAAAEVQGLLVERTATVLQDLQESEGIASENLVSVLPITVDSESILQQRSRFIATGSAGLVGLAMTLFIAGLVDGLSLQRRRGGKSSDGPSVGGPEGVTDSPSADLATSNATPDSTASKPPKPSAPSGPSGPSGPSRTSRPSRPSPSRVLVQSSDDGALDKAASPLRSAR